MITVGYLFSSIIDTLLSIELVTVLIVVCFILLFVIMVRIISYFQELSNRQDKIFLLLLSIKREDIMEKFMAIINKESEDEQKPEAIIKEEIKSEVESDIKTEVTELKEELKSSEKVNSLGIKYGQPGKKPSKDREVYKEEFESLKNDIKKLLLRYSDSNILARDMGISRTMISLIMTDQITTVETVRKYRDIVDKLNSKEGREALKLKEKINRENVISERYGIANSEDLDTFKKLITLSLTNMTQLELALRMEIPQSTLSMLINGKIIKHTTILNCIGKLKVIVKGLEGGNELLSNLKTNG